MQITKTQILLDKRIQLEIISNLIRETRSIDGQQDLFRKWQQLRNEIALLEREIQLDLVLEGSPTPESKVHVAGGGIASTLTTLDSIGDSKSFTSIVTPIVASSPRASCITQSTKVLVTSKSYQKATILATSKNKWQGRIQQKSAKSIDTQEKKIEKNEERRLVPAFDEKTIIHVQRKYTNEIILMGELPVQYVLLYENNYFVCVKGAYLAFPSMQLAEMMLAELISKATLKKLGYGMNIVVTDEVVEMPDAKVIGSIVAIKNTSDVEIKILAPPGSKIDGIDYVMLSKKEMAYYQAKDSAWYYFGFTPKTASSSLKKPDESKEIKDLKEKELKDLKEKELKEKELKEKELKEKERKEKEEKELKEKEEKKEKEELNIPSIVAQIAELRTRRKELLIQQEEHSVRDEFEKALEIEEKILQKDTQLGVLQALFNNLIRNPRATEILNRLKRL